MQHKMAHVPLKLKRHLVGSPKTYPPGRKSWDSLTNNPFPIPILKSDSKITSVPNKKVRLSVHLSNPPFKGFTTQDVNRISHTHNSVMKISESLKLKQKSCIEEAVIRKLGIIRIKTENGLKAYLCKRKFTTVQATATGRNGNTINKTDKSKTLGSGGLEGHPVPNLCNNEAEGRKMLCKICFKVAYFDGPPYKIGDESNSFLCSDCFNFQHSGGDSTVTTNCHISSITSTHPPPPPVNISVSLVKTDLPQQIPLRNHTQKFVNNSDHKPLVITGVHSLADLMASDFGDKWKNRVKPEPLALESMITSARENGNPDDDDANCKPGDEKQVQLRTAEGIYTFAVGHLSGGGSSLRLLSREAGGTLDDPIILDED